MIQLIIVLALALGAGGTVVASDSARPGDFLFPVDRAVEDIRATFTAAEGKAELKVKFAEERLDELESILDDESATSTPNGVSEEARQNLSHALDILTMHLADIHGLASTTPGIAQAISVIEERLQRDAGALPQELKIKIHDDRGRIELKTEEGKVKVKIDSDGELEVEIEDEDDDGDDDEEDNKGPNSGPGSGATSTNSSDDENDDSSSGSSEDDADDDPADESNDSDSGSDDDSNDDSSDDSDDDDNSGSSGNSGSGSGSSGSGSSGNSGNSGSSN